MKNKRTWLFILLLLSAAIPVCIICHIFLAHRPAIAEYGGPEGAFEVPVIRMSQLKYGKGHDYVISVYEFKDSEWKQIASEHLIPQTNDIKLFYADDTGHITILYRNDSSESEQTNQKLLDVNVSESSAQSIFFQDKIILKNKQEHTLLCKLFDPGSDVPYYPDKEQSFRSYGTGDIKGGFAIAIEQVK